MNNPKSAIYYGRELFLAGINNGANGNFSFRQNNKVLITRSGAILSELKLKDFVSIDSPKASSESPAHRIIYENIPGIKAIFHIHSTSAVVLSLKTKENFIAPLDLEGKYYFERIPIINTKLVPGAKDLPGKLLVHQQLKAIIVRGHGVFVFGKTLQECFLRSCTIDNICKIILAV